MFKSFKLSQSRLSSSTLTNGEKDWENDKKLNNIEIK